MTQTAMTTAIVPATEATLALYTARDQSKVDLIADALAIEARSGGVSAFDLTRIRIPTGGGNYWSIPTANGEHPEESFEAIILDWRETRVFWEKPVEESGGGSAPDCSSEDGVHGSGAYGVNSDDNPSGLCERCPKAQWGSRGKGRAQACRSVRQVFLLRPDELLPTLLSLPPSSLRPFKKYALSLASKGVPVYGALTRFTLIKAASQGGIGYSQVAPQVAASIPTDELEWIQNYRTKMLPALRQAANAMMDDTSDED